jgi:hypothetical protein
MKSFEEQLQITEDLVFQKTGEHLNDLQRIILHESWQETKKTYDEIAKECGYSANYIKQGVGPKLWKLLSKAFGEKVTKTNVRSAIERYILDSNKFDLEPPSNADSFVNKLGDLDPQDRGEFSRRKFSSVQYRPFEIELEWPQNSVPLGSPFYIERVPYESQCDREIEKPGSFIRIKAPRQMGKSSMMNRILARAKQKGYTTGLLHFQQIEATALIDLNRLLRWFCSNLALQLGFKPNLDNFWDEDLGSKMSCTLYLEAYLLNSIKTPFILALEEVNQIIEHPDLAKEFLTLLRFWYERTKTDATWQKLRLIMVHSTEIYIPLDINQSPLNIGLRVELPPFDIQQVSDLVRRHHLDLGTEQIAQLMELVSGHPYLIRLSLYHLAKGDLSWRKLIENASTDSGIYGEVLHRNLRYLQQNPDLARAFIRVLQTDDPVELEQVDAFKLYSMGLVNLLGNQVTVSCDLYRQYFRDRLLS